MVTSCFCVCVVLYCTLVTSSIGSGRQRLSISPLLLVASGAYSETPSRLRMSGGCLTGKGHTLRMFVCFPLELALSTKAVLIFALASRVAGPRPDEIWTVRSVRDDDDLALGLASLLCFLHLTSFRPSATMTQLDTSGKELVSIPGVSVSHLLNGDSTPLANGILSLQLIKIELPSRAASPTPVDAKGKGTGPPPLPPRLPRAQDEWLLLTLVTHAGDVEPVLELPVPSSSRILSAPPSSYIIPNTQPGVDESTSGFFKITLPSTVETEARETFEAVLWGLTGFSSPTSEASVTSPKPTPVHDKDLRSKLVLVDDQGTVLGAIGDGQAGESLAEDPSLSLENQGLHEKEPVVVEASQGSGNAFNFTVRPLSKFEPTPNPSGSSIINAADFISRGIVVGAEMIGRTMEYGADRYTNSRKATDAPIVFSPTTTKSIQTTHAYTGKVVKVSAKTAATIGSLANGVGDKIGKSLGIQSEFH